MPIAEWAARSQDFPSGPWGLSALGIGPGRMFKLKVSVLYLDLTGDSSVRALGILVGANPRQED